MCCFWGITPAVFPIVKTEITIGDDIFEAAESLALSLGMSRSELYSTAIQAFVSRHLRRRVTERLNEVYGADDSDSAHDEELNALQVRSLPTEDWK